MRAFDTNRMPCEGTEMVKRKYVKSGKFSKKNAVVDVKPKITRQPLFDEALTTRLVDESNTKQHIWTCKM